MKKIISLMLAGTLAVSSIAMGSTSVGAVSKIKSDKGDFYLQQNKSINNGTNHSYKIYGFNVNSKSAKALNKKIYKDFKKYYKYDKNSFATYWVKGTTYTNENILSIKQIATAPSWYEYKAYNLNKKTGKKITVSALCKKYGYTKKSLYSTVKKKQISLIKSKLKKYSYSESISKKMLSYVKSDKSRKNLQVYVNKSGKLCAIAHISTCAAADIYPHIFTLSKK